MLIQSSLGDFLRITGLMFHSQRELRWFRSKDVLVLHFNLLVHNLLCEPCKATAVDQEVKHSPDKVVEYEATISQLDGIHFTVRVQGYSFQSGNDSQK